MSDGRVHAIKVIFFAIGRSVTKEESKQLCERVSELQGLVSSLLLIRTEYWTDWLCQISSYFCLLHGVTL